MLKTAITLEHNFKNTFWEKLYITICIKMIDIERSNILLQQRW